MSVEVTTNWSGCSFSSKPPWTAVMEYTVTGVADDYSACNVAGIPQINAQHAASGILLCEGPVVTAVKGPLTRVVRCNFSVSPQREALRAIRQSARPTPSHPMEQRQSKRGNRPGHFWQSSSQQRRRSHTQRHAHLPVQAIRDLEVRALLRSGQGARF